MRKFLASAVLAAMLSGCAGVPKAAPDFASAVEAGTMPGSTARLVVCGGRTQALLFSLQGAIAAVFVDGKNVGRTGGFLRNDACLPIELARGTYEVAIGFSYSAPLRITLTAGQQAVLRVDKNEEAADVAGAFGLLGALASIGKNAPADPRFKVTEVPAPLPGRVILAPVQD
ncbi:MAG: hypothetical protein ACREFO_09190 [Acetobacteraceae bacterium]